MPLDEFVTKIELDKALQKNNAQIDHLIEQNNLFREALKALEDSYKTGTIAVKATDELPKIKKIQQSMTQQVQQVTTQTTALETKLRQLDNLDEVIRTKINELAPIEVNRLVRSADNREQRIEKRNFWSHISTLICVLILSTCGVGILWLFITKLL